MGDNSIRSRGEKLGKAAWDREMAAENRVKSGKRSGGQPHEIGNEEWRIAASDQG